MESRPHNIIESFLLGILTDPATKQVLLTFRSADGEQAFSLRAQNVAHLLVTDLREQNIVHDIQVFKGGIDEAHVRDLLAMLLFERNDSSEVTEPEFLRRLSEVTTSIIEANQLLLELEPVYGASVLLLASSVEWSMTSNAGDAPER